MIQKREIREGVYQTQIREFSGLHDLLDIADRRVHEGVDDLGNDSITGDFSFSGTHSLEEAVTLASKGWPEGVERMSSIAEGIEVDSTLLQSALRLNQFFDIDRYLQGEPENMVSFVQTQQSHGKILDIVINAAQHARVDKKEIENRGAAILAAVDTLRTNGYSVGVFIVDQREPSYERGYTRVRYEIPVLEPGQAVSVDTLAFTIMHPSFLRRLLFAANESEDRHVRRSFGFEEHGGYGVPVLLDDYTHFRPAYVIDKDDGLHTDPHKVQKFAQKVVRKSLKALNAEDQQ